MKLRLNGLVCVRGSACIGTLVVRAEMVNGTVRYGVRFDDEDRLFYYTADQIYPVYRALKLSKAQESALIRCAAGPAKVHPSTAAVLLYHGGGLIRHWDMPTGMYELNQRGRAWILEHHPKVELCDRPATLDANESGTR